MLKILSPQNNQVFQRDDFDKGNVIFSGTVHSEMDTISIDIVTENNQEIIKSVAIKVDNKKHFYLQEKICAGGWYSLKIRDKENKVNIENDIRFGVGEVFVVAGQSNSTNYGEECSKQFSGMISSFAFNRWSIATDPLPGAHDTSSGGSPWLFFGDLLYQYLQVPIGIAITGHGGTKIKEWLPNSDFYSQSDEKKGLFNWMMIRLQQLGIHGCRAIIWHQGESDAGNNTKEEVYYYRLKKIIEKSREECGWHVPWFVGLVSYRTPDNPISEPIRNAQKKICSDDIAFLGVDTDTLTGDNRDLQGLGIHFSLKGLEVHGKMWAEKIGKWFRN
ncbi:sialate O-acetylesterase [Candidatus Uabimicrobium sp. HlEnr_7]|uniref:sialate O-acetylesterase n=1 Tax=Candidatus Uabimicrobium helgolandensis TaxID=3095367 RepID=UPI003558DD8A